MAQWLIALTAGLALMLSQPAPARQAGAELDAAAAEPVCPLLGQPVPVGHSIPGELTIGYRTDAAPFSYLNEEGEPAGYSVGLCTTIAEALVGRDHVRYKATTASSRFVDLAEKHIDLLCDSSTLTWYRAACFDYTLLTFPSGPALAVAAEIAAAPPASRVRVGVLGEPSSTAAKVVAPGMKQSIAHSLNAEAIELVYMSSYGELFHGLTPPKGTERQLDAVFADREILLTHAQRHPARISVKQDYFSYEPYTIYLRPNRTLRVGLNRELAVLYATPRIHQLLNANFPALAETVGQLIKLQRVPAR